MWTARTKFIAIDDLSQTENFPGIDNLQINSKETFPKTKSKPSFYFELYILLNQTFFSTNKVIILQCKCSTKDSYNNF